MGDTYANFEQLAAAETAGVDYAITIRRARRAFAIVAPHGGGIEPGTSEVADAIAAHRDSFYAFDGLKRSGNSVLHITSTRFDEPMCSVLLSQSDVIVTVHGEAGATPVAVIYLGGLDLELGARIRCELQRHGFRVDEPPDPVAGNDPDNVCNRGASRRGVQLELSRPLRESLFESLTQGGRRHPTARFHALVAAIRSALDAPADKQGD